MLVPCKQRIFSLESSVRLYEFNLFMRNECKQKRDIGFCTVIINVCAFTAQTTTDNAADLFVKCTFALRRHHPVKVRCV